MTDIVTDSEGNQLDYFNFTIEEKIGLPSYSSVTIRASLSRNIEDTDEARQEVIDLVEAVTAAERGKVLDSLGVAVN